MGTAVNSSKLWDGVALFLGLLLSLTLVASVIQLTVGGEVLDTFTSLTLRVINIIFAVSIALMIIIVVLENGSPANTLAWVMVLIFIPGVGFVFYLLFGRNWRKRRLFSRKGLIDSDMLSKYFGKEPPAAWEEAFPEATRKLMHLLENNSKAVLTYQNSLTLLDDTNTAFQMMLEGIRAAREHVHLEYFSIDRDETGNTLKDLLIAKAKAGVEVRFIYDDVGCWKLGRKFKRELRLAGVQFVPFMPVWIPFLNSHMNYRNHRKLVIVDGCTAYLGGLNIGDKYLGKHRYFGYWRDSLARIEGEGARTLQAIFLIDWFFVSRQNLFHEQHRDQYLKSCKNLAPGITALQIAASGPDSDQASIMQLYFAAINSARFSICISTPYLILNESLRMALKTAAISGVKVRIVLPAKPDHFMVFWASRSYFSDLMEVGIELWEYQKGFNHAKIMIVDDSILLIGSANMDLRSFNHNFELTAAIYNNQVATEALAQFHNDLQHSTLLKPEEFSHRSVVQKSKESICRLVSPLL